eukprot:9471118-Pyramimonas_sp.AAC.1
MFGKIGVRSTERAIYRGMKRKYGQQYADLQQEVRLGTAGHLQMQAIHLQNKERTLSFEYQRIGAALVRVGGVAIGQVPLGSSASSSAASSSAAPSAPATPSPAP